MSRSEGVERLEQERAEMAAKKQMLGRKRARAVAAKTAEYLAMVRSEPARLKAEAAARRAAREDGCVSVPELVVLFAVLADAVLCFVLTGSVLFGLVAWFVTLACAVWITLVGLRR
jgi:type IV secretory pathway TrbD component